MTCCQWRRAHYGWCAFANGKRLSVRRYRRGDGRGFVYVARVNESAAKSPAEPHRTAAAAKTEAEQIAEPRGEKR